MFSPLIFSPLISISQNLLTNKKIYDIILFTLCFSSIFFGGIMDDDADADTCHSCTVYTFITQA